jgi:hypothetical protein
MVNWAIVSMVKITFFEPKFGEILPKNENIGHFFQSFQFKFRVVQWGEGRMIRF